MTKRLIKPKLLLDWSLTPWMMNGEGGWKTQPVILVEGRKPFFADTPQEYIAELERLEQDAALAPGIFFTVIGQLKDALKIGWNPGVMELPHLVPAQEATNGKEGHSQN